MTKLKSSGQKSWLQFCLRTLLAMLVLVATYFAGWVSHRQWNRRNVDAAIQSAMRRIEGPVQVETPKDAGQVFILRGRKDDVAEVDEAIRDVDAAARK
jgi:CHASE3 domain sensor protein